MARTAHGSRARAPSPYTVSVGNATSPPRRISAAASSRSAGDLALSSRVSTSRNAFERRLVDSFPDQLRDRAAPGLPQLGDPCLQHAPADQRGPADLPDVLERRAAGLADCFHGLAIRRRERDDDARGISPKSSASGRSCDFSATRHPRSRPKHISASVTASPPSEQSCADFSNPARTQSRTAFCTARSRAKSSGGGTPATLPWTVLRYSLPPRWPWPKPPTMATRSPAAMKQLPAFFAQSSIRPTIPIIGVGITALPSVSL